MTRSVGILLLALAGLAMLPQIALAGQFKKPVYYSAPGLPWAVVTADFNGDNNLDLAVADFGNQFVGTLLGKGNGSFRKGPSFSVSPYSPVALAVGDFDGDQIPDLAVVEYNGPADGKLGIFLGNGRWPTLPLAGGPLKPSFGLSGAVPPAGQIFPCSLFRLLAAHSHSIFTVPSQPAAYARKLLHSQSSAATDNPRFCRKSSASPIHRRATPCFSDLIASARLCCCGSLTAGERVRA
jgi:hypothetical protein